MNMLKWGEGDSEANTYYSNVKRRQVSSVNRNNSEGYCKQKVGHLLTLSMNGTRWLKLYM